MSNIHEVIINTNGISDVIELYQHDTGQILKFDSSVPNGAQVQFDDGKYVVVANGCVTIPDDYLTVSGFPVAWVQVIATNSNTTLYTIRMHIIHRVPKTVTTSGGT